MPVGASLNAVVGDGVLSTDDDNGSIPLADALKRPQAVRGKLTRTATHIEYTYRNKAIAFSLDDDGEFGWTPDQALSFGRIVDGSRVTADPEITRALVDAVLSIAANTPK